MQTKKTVGKTLILFVTVLILGTIMESFVRSRSKTMETTPDTIQTKQQSSSSSPSSSSSSSSIDQTKNRTITKKRQSKHNDWWQSFVEEISIVYKPSNSTDWCNQAVPSSVGNSNKKFWTPDRSKKKEKLFNTNPNRNRKLEELKEPPKTGMYLVKTIKAGSSTAAGVSLQIAETVAQQKGFGRDQTCPHHVHHGKMYLQRQDPYFLWTIVREPSRRDISEYFFHEISRQKQLYNSTQFIFYLHRKRNFQLRYIGLQSKTGRTKYNTYNATQSQAMEMISSVMDTYHFIAVTERMDESLVVLKLLFGFADEAIISLSSKRAGGLDDGNHGGRCREIQKAYTTPDVDLYLDNLHRPNNLDYFLYAVVNRSLDKTIDMLGRERVEREVQRHRALQQLAEDGCFEKTVFPCRKKGESPSPLSRRYCYFGDVGCGHVCVMKVIQEHKTRQ